MTKSQEILLIRHGHDDESYIDGNFDTDLTIEGIRQTRKMARHIIRTMHQMGDLSGMQIYSSDKRRAIETTAIMQEEADQAGYLSTATIDSRLEGLREGFIADAERRSFEEKAALLNRAWVIFDHARKAGNDNYCFGDPVEDETYHSDIAGFIKYPYGESQNMFTDRVYGAFSDVLGNALTGNLPVIVTHRGPISKIKHFVDSSNQGTWTEEHKKSELLSMGYNVVLQSSVHDVDFCKQLLGRYLCRKVAPHFTIDDTVFMELPHETVE